jgi:hypothetical protein
VPCFSLPTHLHTSLPASAVQLCAPPPPSALPHLNRPTTQLKIASQVYDFIDAHIRDLDTDLSNFRTEVSEDRSKLGLGEDTTAREALGRPPLAAPPKAEQQKQQGGGEGRQAAQQKKKAGRRKTAAAAAAAAAAPAEEPGEAAGPRLTCGLCPGSMHACLWAMMQTVTAIGQVWFHTHQQPPAATCCCTPVCIHCAASTPSQQLMPCQQWETALYLQLQTNQVP